MNERLRLRPGRRTIFVLRSERPVDSAGVAGRVDEARGAAAGVVVLAGVHERRDLRAVLDERRDGREREDVAGTAEPADDLVVSDELGGPRLLFDPAHRGTDERDRPDDRDARDELGVVEASPLAPGGARPVHEGRVLRRVPADVEDEEVVGLRRRGGADSFEEVRARVDVVLDDQPVRRPGRGRVERLTVGAPRRPAGVGVGVDGEADVAAQPSAELVREVGAGRVRLDRCGEPQRTRGTSRRSGWDASETRSSMRAAACSSQLFSKRLTP